MQEIQDAKQFKGWPFRGEDRREDGEINNGAFDLVVHPEKIDAIHEATEANGLRPLLVYLNRTDGHFMTLGCASGLADDGLYYSYLQFTARQAESAMRTAWPQDLEQNWMRFLDHSDTTLPGIAVWLGGRCGMGYQRFFLRPETDQRLLVCMDLRASNEKEHNVVTSHVQNFFHLLESGQLN